MSVLKIKKLSKNFGGVKALQEVDLNVEKGKITALIGPNGSGKTTLFNVVSGLYRSDSGTILFKDQEISLEKPHNIVKKGITRTFQNIRIFKSLTVLENVVIGQHCRNKANTLASIFRSPHSIAEEKQAIIKALATLEFVGLKENIYDLAANLPYGKKRLLEIARAIASSPGLILLDEPAAGMNDIETLQLQKLVQRIRDEKNVSILLVEHDMKVVMGISNYIYVLDYGRKIAEGDAKSIRENPAVIEAYLGKEAQRHAAS